LRLDSLYIIDEKQSKNVVTFKCVFSRYVMYEVRRRRSEMAGMLPACFDNVVTLVVKDDVFRILLCGPSLVTASNN